MSITVYEGRAVEDDALSSYRFSVWFVLFFLSSFTHRMWCSLPFLVPRRLSKKVGTF